MEGWGGMGWEDEEKIVVGGFAGGKVLVSCC